MAEIKQRLGASRLVTLTGPGGVGKTRLALRAAAELVRAFADGVWLIELARIQDALLVPQAVFNALGLRDHSTGWSMTTLTEYLAGKQVLLILDNCEHVLDSCAVLASTLLKACPELRLLATSRQPLGIAGEGRMLVSPLSLPEERDGMVVEELMNFDAVTLLGERAAAVAFVLTRRQKRHYAKRPDLLGFRSRESFVTPSGIEPTQCSPIGWTPNWLI